MIPVLILCAFLVGACAPEPQRQTERDFVTLTPLPSQRESTTNTLVPDQYALSPTLEPAPGASDQSGSDAHYRIDAVLSWSERALRVEQTVTYRNTSASPLASVVFTVETNRYEGQFSLERVTVGKQAVETYTLDGARLEIPLPEPLRAHGDTDLSLTYDLILPEIQDGYENGHLGYWGYSPRQTNLGLWFPLVAARDSAEHWLTPEPHWLGEHFALPVADFIVQLTIEGGPDMVRVAGPGAVSRPGAHSWRFELTAAREVAISVSDGFRTLSASAPSGVGIDLFYFPEADAQTLDTPRHALYTAVDALALYEDLYGAYPHQRLVIVEGDFPDGMEFSGLVFVSEAWFRAWQHVPNDWLTIITAHEVAHQWWYALVANDQAHDPYLDEALATYSEALFFERYYPDYLNWWWSFRIAKYEPTGYVDTPVYAFYSPRGYVDTVYLRGALMMRALRVDLGDEVFLAWLHHYCERMAGKIASPVDFWRALPADAYARTANTRAYYLQQPDPLPPPDSIP
jgi:hypothetical protein